MTETLVLFDRSTLLAMSNAEPGLAKSVDADVHGKSISDYSVLLWGAYGPAVERIVNLAIKLHGANAPAPITRTQLMELAPEAIAQKVDYYFKHRPDAEEQPIHNYGMILDEKDYNYHAHLLALTNLALRKYAERAAAANQ